MIQIFKHAITGEMVEVDINSDWREVHPADIPSVGHWVFERGSGYPGYRCTKCGEWEYDGRQKNCACDRANPIKIRKATINIFRMKGK